MSRTPAPLSIFSGVVLLGTFSTSSTGCLLLKGEPAYTTTRGMTVGFWRRTERLSISDVQLRDNVGDAQTETYEFTYTPKPGGWFSPTYESVWLTLEVQFGQSRTSATGGFPAIVQAPREMDLTVNEEVGWIIGMKCDDAVSVGLPDAGLQYAADTVLFQSCEIHLVQDDYDGLVLLEVFGDGKINMQTTSGEVSVN
ncbi:MAG: hypothetical protein AAFV53_03865 [Myxococcota bacterium]